ncbi:MAG TPA: DOMON-like domain-containing protein [Steroidobacteraceae bacterium]
MSAARDVPIGLNCHAVSACDAVRSVHATVHTSAGLLTLSYVLDADLKHLRIPAASAPARTNELWRHTCFEAFLREEGARGYRELNFAPSLSWAMYRFSAPREGMLAVPATLAPRITIARGAAGLTLEAIVLLRDLFPASVPLMLRVGLAAVVEDENGSLSYWATRHAPGKPNFHHPDNFTLEIAV